MKRFILILFLLMLNILGISAQEPTRDSLRVSLITCTPGQHAYAHFGHTAIRLTNITNGEDIVFNYGCFDSTVSNFVMKFIKGETDYVVDAEEAEYFFARYDYIGRGVTEQVLNLTQDECQKLAELLFTNILPTNRGYRYNWLYDNCTTRARDVIEKAINGKVSYTNDLPSLTARNELHECLYNDSWLRLGVDLLLGTEIDKHAPRKVQQFIPAHYENDLNNAEIITTDGLVRKMVAGQYPILGEKDSNKAGDTPFTPVIVFSLLCIIASALSIYDIRRKIISYWFDALLHLLQGIAGIIIAYLFFFSLHPAVSTNWQVIIFNPLYILYAIYIIYCHVKNKKDRLINVNTAVLCIFVIVVLIAKQDINVSVWIMAFTLCIRNLTRYHIILKTNKNSK
ncbi:MAG: DUF4105 domain-containing protein [Bacteroidaceae bacterium]|nr:DUF4105 domain-containing protein [Bacteroidaceae bacterium]